VRLIGPPEAVDAALAMLAGTGPWWQADGRQRSRKNAAHDVQYGTLIVPVAPHD
jgi:hypothetical protein